MLTLTRYIHSIRGTSSHLVSVLQGGKKGEKKKDVPLAQFMYLYLHAVYVLVFTRSLCTLYLHAVYVLVFTRSLCTLYLHAVYVPCIYTQFMYLVFTRSLCTLYLHACQVRVTVGGSGLCCVCVTYFRMVPRISNAN